MNSFREFHTGKHSKTGVSNIQSVSQILPLEVWNLACKQLAVSYFLLRGCRQTSWDEPTMELSGSSSSWLWLSSDVQTSSAAWCFLRPGPCQGHWLQSHRKVFFPLSWDPQLFTAGSNGDEGNVNSGEEAGLWQEEHSPGQLLLTKSSSQWECSSCWHPTCYPLCLPPVGKSGKDLLSSPPPQCWVSSWRTGKLKHRMYVACWCLECQGNSHWLCEQWKWKRKKTPAGAGTLWRTWWNRGLWLKAGLFCHTAFLPDQGQ